MYRKIETPPTPIEKFELPFEGKLAEDNRWVIMANLIPWSEFEDEYAQQFTIEMGAPAKSFRTAIGALIIKERLGLSDRETDVPPERLYNCVECRKILKSEPL
jgi:IS5 family transposase